jgi:hypothetical protein
MSTNVRCCHDALRKFGEREEEDARRDGTHLLQYWSFDSMYNGLTAAFVFGSSWPVVPFDTSMKN